MRHLTDEEHGEHREDPGGKKKAYYRDTPGFTGAWERRGPAFERRGHKMYSKMTVPLGEGG